MYLFKLAAAAGPSRGRAEPRLTESPPAEANVYPGARASRSQLVPHRFGQMDLFELDDLVLGGRIAGRKGVQSVSQQACLGSAGPSPLRLERWQWPCRSRRRSWADGQKTKQMSAQPKKGVLSWIPYEMHSTFTGVHRAFSYGNRERSLASTERSLMDTIRNALEFTERSLMDPQSVLSWTPFEMHWNSS